MGEWRKERSLAAAGREENESGEMKGRKKGGKGDESDKEEEDREKEDKEREERSRGQKTGEK